jgi:hypothetical protein
MAPQALSEPEEVVVKEKPKVEMLNMVLDLPREIKIKPKAKPSNGPKKARVKKIKGH